MLAPKLEQLLAMPPARRFPTSWTFEDKNDACFIVHDASGLAVAYVYYE